MLSSKQTLLDKLAKQPLLFDEADFAQLLSPGINLTFDDLRSTLKRVFNISETALLAQSDATTGPMGWFNRFITSRRQRAYFTKVNGGFVGKADHHVLVAEGDSWFQFIGRDIINWLDDQKKYAIFSIAYAGDWWANILFEEKYIEELSIHKPAAFLISGGGNDLVGGNRVAIMTCLNPHTFLPRKRTDWRALIQLGCTDSQADQILSVQHHILPDFHAFVLILKCQYYLMFSSLRKAADLNTMAVITQGYDYAIPHAGLRWTMWYQGLVNWAIGSGKWLAQPLMIRGIKDRQRQRAIIMAMIFELNEMFINLAKREEFPYLYHIDSRGNASDHDWFDELHLKPVPFKRVAAAYEHCLKAHFAHLDGPDKAGKNRRSVFITKKIHEVDRPTVNYEPVN